MNILKSLLSGGSATLFKENTFSGIHDTSGNVRSSVQIYDTVRQRRNAKSKMEFMYCIPDLEVFIDKTIKKCLLEYDLDANDTEAVLDDMEKAWPKTPPRNSEKQVLKDCNDNTEKGWSQKQSSATNVSSDVGVVPDKSGAKVEEALLEKVKASDVSNTAEKNRPKEAEFQMNGATNEKKISEAGGGESDRSGCSSPDVTEGKFTTKRHAKLKSRLQQRYFEGNHESDNTGPVEKPEEPGVSSLSSRLGQPSGHVASPSVHHQGQQPQQPQQQANAYRPSNLDILASAVNLHTESVRREEEIRLQAFQNFQENDGRQSQASFSEVARDASGRLQDEAERHRSNEVGRDLSTQREMPALVRHLSSSCHPFTNGVNGDRLSYSPNHYQNALMSQPRPDGRFFASRSGESSKLVHSENQGDQNGHHVMIPREGVVFRREIPMEGRRHSREATHAHNQMLFDQDGVAKPRNSQFPQSFYPSNMMPSTQPMETPKEATHPFHKHSSRIASIIAEELQRDEECQHKPAIVRNVSLVERINPDEGKTSTMKEFRLFHNGISGLQKLAGNDKRVPESQILHQNHLHGNVSQLPRTFGMSESQISHLYPPHAKISHAKTDSPRVSPISLDNHSLNRYHNGGSQAIRNYTPNDFVVNYSSENSNQPQDLSVKSRRNEPETHSKHYSSLPVRSDSPVGSHSPVGERLMKGYFSSPSSPLHPTAAHGHGEAQLQRKSASPTISSFKQYNVYPPTNSLRLPDKWEKRDQLHGMEHINNSLAMDSRVIADRRMAETIQRWSEARQTEINKKRGNALH
ncbi:unnamed protein product [Lymnaea stagnalis]|uniref:Uncharacterized protein n=1 Tax=Lymnaea stagnalis TaxID=6523 RepID=A0AAV2HS92_LYMST